MTSEDYRPYRSDHPESSDAAPHPSGAPYPPGAQYSPGVPTSPYAPGASYQPEEQGQFTTPAGYPPPPDGFAPPTAPPPAAPTSAFRARASVPQPGSQPPSGGHPQQPVWPDQSQQGAGERGYVDPPGYDRNPYAPQGPGGGQGMQDAYGAPPQSGYGQPPQGVDYGQPPQGVDYGQPPQGVDYGQPTSGIPDGGPGQSSWQQPSWQQPGQPQQYGEGYGAQPTGSGEYGAAVGDQPEEPKSRRTVMIAVVAAVAVLAVVAVAVVMYLNNSGNASFAVGTCVKQSQKVAVAANCSDKGAYKVVTKTENSASCSDQAQPFVVIQHSGSKDEVLCLAPASS
jgi:hypothetical protein